MCPAASIRPTGSRLAGLGSAPRVVYWKSGEEATLRRPLKRRSASAGSSRFASSRDPASIDLFDAGRLSRPARSRGTRRVPEHVRDPGHRARRSVVDERADDRVGSAGRRGMAGTAVSGRLLRRRTSRRQRALAFGDIGDLKPALDRALQSLDSFQPRDWVLENMTDAVCSKRLYELIKEEAGRAGQAGQAEGTERKNGPIRTRSGTGSSAPEDAGAARESGGDGG